MDLESLVQNPASSSWPIPPNRVSDEQKMQGYFSSLAPGKTFFQGKLCDDAMKYLEQSYRALRPDDFDSEKEAPLLNELATLAIDSYNSREDTHYQVLEIKKACRMLHPGLGGHKIIFTFKAQTSDTKKLQYFQAVVVKCFDDQRKLIDVTIVEPDDPWYLTRGARQPLGVSFSLQGNRLWSSQPLL